jgi:hypothetical protein
VVVGEGEQSSVDVIELTATAWSSDIDSGETRSQADH